MGPDERNDESFVLDKEKLLCSINSVAKNRYTHFFVWGGEPLLHFSALAQTISFLQSNFPESKITVSTNGFLLKEKHIRNFILQSGIALQLSCDGISQNLRSNFNPLENEIVSNFLSKLANENRLVINCVMHKQNYSVNKNIDYFAAWMKRYSCIETSLDIRFTPFTESDLTPNFNFSGSELDFFLHEYEMLYMFALFGDKNNEVMKHFVNFPLKIVRKSNLQKCDWANSNMCAKYSSGIANKSRHIDTKGNFVACNLIDSGIQPRGKIEKNIPPYCSACEFLGTRGCYPCPAGDFPQKCEWKKKWMQFQKRMLLLRSIAKTDFIR